MELGGVWRASPSDDARLRDLPDPSADDRAWPQVAVPGQWESEPAIPPGTATVLYRHRFSTEPLPEGRRAWLRFGGLFYQADVWLDGSYLGDAEGFLAPHELEVTPQVAARSEHLVGVELTCSPPDDLRRKQNLTGVFQHWDAIDPAFNPGGIWAPVTLTTSGPVRIAALRVVCREADEQRAVLELAARLDASEATEAAVTTTVRRHDPGRPVEAGAGGSASPVAGSEQTHRLAAGVNRVRWRVTVERPALWWPRALGDQPLHDLRVDVGVGGEPSDEREVTTGLRRVRMRGWVATVNGERLFLKGANIGPTDRELSKVTAEVVEADLELARRANLDLLHVHAHVAHPLLYDAADRAGMLLWQDMPLQWRYGQVRREAIRQAGLMVDVLSHHPSIAMWCGHDEPSSDGGPGSDTGAGSPWSAQLRRARRALPDGNRTTLDRSIRRALERADPSRPVVTHAGVGPHPAGATDTHLAVGWGKGDGRDLAKVLARWPVLARFVGAFGPPAVPESAGFAVPGLWPDLAWDRLAEAHGLDLAGFRRHLPPADYPTFDTWRAESQRRQAESVRHHVETLRRLKYRPTGGFCHALLIDAQPAVSRSLVDDRRIPKEAFAALAAACAPVIIVADRPARSYPQGSAVELDVHAVSDLRQPVDELRARATLRWPGGSRSWSWSGELPADSCVKVGRVAHRLPADAAPGDLELALELTWREEGAQRESTSCYRSNVVPVAPG